MIIRGEFIALISFPGVILHEIAHRFFCDLFDIPVFHVNYFNMESTTNAGHVIHQKTDNIRHAFFIGVGPLIINSIVCILLTFPYAMTYTLDAQISNSYISFLYSFLGWVGFSAGFHAVPSNADVENLFDMTETISGGILIGVLTLAVSVFNINYIGPAFRVLFSLLLCLLVPALYYGFNVMSMVQ